MKSVLIILYSEPNFILCIKIFSWICIEIYKYVLSLNLADDNEDYPYINSKIIDDFNKYINYITQPLLWISLNVMMLI